MKRVEKEKVFGKCVIDAALVRCWLREIVTALFKDNLSRTIHDLFMIISLSENSLWKENSWKAAIPMIVTFQCRPIAIFSGMESIMWHCLVTCKRTFHCYERLYYFNIVMNEFDIPFYCSFKTWFTHFRHVFLARFTDFWRKVEKECQRQDSN